MSTGALARLAARCAAASAAVALALGAAPAAAAPGFEVGLEDERLLLSEPAEAPQVVRDMAAAGVDTVRIHARWAALAPAGTRRPADFDPARQSGYDWTALDRAIALVRDAGMTVTLTVTGPGPVWTSGRPERVDPRYKPDPRAFGTFAGVVAARYEAAVDRYLVWNEPNQGGWLQPQWERRGRTWYPASAHHYRELVRAARPAILAADPGAEVVIGELAPIGSRRRGERAPVAPVPFLRALGCVDDRYRPLRDGPCRSFRPVGGDAIGYHPHPVRNAPDQVNPDRDEAQLADMPRLFGVLDRLTGAGRILAPGGRFDVHFTEFGYQTSPPDHVVGITVAQHARWLQQASYIAWRNPRILSLVHYQWRDEPVHYRGPSKRAYSGWQSGLRYVDDTPKPAFETFRTPFVVERPRGRSSARFWGHVRPGGVHTVSLQRRDDDGSFEEVARLLTNEFGEWSTTLAVGGDDAAYRFVADPEPAVAGAESLLSAVLPLRARFAGRLQAGP